jgi:hypothetical protein
MTKELKKAKQMQRQGLVSKKHVKAIARAPVMNPKTGRQAMLETVIKNKK